MRWRIRPAGLLRLLVALVVAAVLAPLFVLSHAPAEAAATLASADDGDDEGDDDGDDDDDDDDGAERKRGRPVLHRAPVVVEFNDDGSAGSGEAVGRSVLLRTGDGLMAGVRVRGLKPGGVYTFWWIVIQDDGTFPDDIHAASGAYAIANRRGRANVRMTAQTGDAGITGFRPDGVNEITFAELHDPLGSTVRVEIAYHGQAADAGGELPIWFRDFWTGTACPRPGELNAIGQPHCPVTIAATHP